MPRRGFIFENQIKKVCDYVEAIGGHAHKNYAERLQDGTYIIQFGSTAGRPVFAFDINGKKGPNRWGYDLYGIIIYGNNDGMQYFKGYLTKETGGKTLEERLDAVGLK